MPSPLCGVDSAQEGYHGLSLVLELSFSSTTTLPRKPTFFTSTHHHFGEGIGNQLSWSVPRSFYAWDWQGGQPAGWQLAWSEVDEVAAWEDQPVVPVQRVNLCSIAKATACVRLEAPSLEIQALT